MFVMPWLPLALLQNWVLVMRQLQKHFLNSVVLAVVFSTMVKFRLPQVVASPYPVEMAATLAAARGAFPDRRLVLAFQPHRFTRTRDCFGEFVQVLRDFDALVLTEVYPAGEAKIPGADGKSLMKAALAEDKYSKGSLNSTAVVFAANIAEMPDQSLRYRIP
jgi:Mur ligase family, glutamate ligase domain